MKKLSLMILLLIAGASPLFALRIYFIGNSLTDGVNYRGFEELVLTAGQDIQWGRHMIPGANPTWIWEHPSSGISEPPYGLYPNALGNYTWDVMTIQPTDNLQLDSSATNKFINLAKKRSPAIQLYIFGQHPYLEPLRGLENPSVGEDYDKHWLLPMSVIRQRLGGYGKGTKEYHDTLTVELRKHHPELVNSVKLIPAGNVLYALNQIMKNPSHVAYPTLQRLGYHDVSQLYNDDAHINSVGGYIQACTFFATMYKTDPAGLSVPQQYGSIAADFVNIVHQVVWQVVTTHDLSGVTISTAIRMNAQQKQALFHNLNTHGASNAPALLLNGARLGTQGRTAHMQINAATGRKGVRVSQKAQR